MSFKRTTEVCNKGPVYCSRHAANLGNAFASNSYSCKKERKGL